MTKASTPSDSGRHRTGSGRGDSLFRERKKTNAATTSSTATSAVTASCVPEALNFSFCLEPKFTRATPSK